MLRKYEVFNKIIFNTYLNIILIYDKYLQRTGTENCR